MKKRKFFVKQNFFGEYGVISREDPEYFVYLGSRKDAYKASKRLNTGKFSSREVQDSKPIRTWYGTYPGSSHYTTVKKRKRKMEKIS